MEANEVGEAERAGNQTGKEKPQYTRDEGFPWMRSFGPVFFNSKILVLNI
jgi:hypothetical protein